MGKVGIAVATFGVCDFSRLAVTDWHLRRWRLRRWRLWFLALMTATRYALIRIVSIPLYSVQLGDERWYNVRYGKFLCGVYF